MKTESQILIQIHDVEKDIAMMEPTAGRIAWEYYVKALKWVLGDDLKLLAHLEILDKNRKTAMTITSKIDSSETICNVMKLAKKDNLSSVILEPTPGKSWQYSRSGVIMAQDQLTSEVVAGSKGTRYAICAPIKEGMWACSIVDDSSHVIKEVKTRL
jgi:hypothetical protein